MAGPRNWHRARALPGAASARRRTIRARTYAGYVVFKARADPQGEMRAADKPPPTSLVMRRGTFVLSPPQRQQRFTGHGERPRVTDLNRALSENSYTAGLRQTGHGPRELRSPQQLR